VRLAQVFYHLGELNESLTYALGAGALFDVTEDSEFVTTLLGAARSGPPGARPRH
jgi:26S proteasome regulatory subunit N2